MKTVELKNRIENFLDLADDCILRIVNGVFENYYQDETVAFHPNGTPMSRKEYVAALDVAESQIEKGDYISGDEFEREV